MPSLRGHVETPSTNRPVRTCHCGVVDGIVDGIQGTYNLYTYSKKQNKPVFPFLLSSFSAIFFWLCLFCRYIVRSFLCSCLYVYACSLFLLLSAADAGAHYSFFFSFPKDSSCWHWDLSVSHVRSLFVCPPITSRSNRYVTTHFTTPKSSNRHRSSMRPSRMLGCSGTKF